MRGEESFAAMLRRLRDSTTAQVAGLRPSSSRSRRAPGLRREELADPAGISVDYLKRLERGSRHPSPAVVDALARALQLAPAEHSRLRGAAGYSSAPSNSSTRMPREITDATQRVVDALTEVPVAIVDASWTVLAGNGRFHAFECIDMDAAERERNMALRTFTDAPTAILRTPEALAAFRTSIVEDLRAAAYRYPRDPDLNVLIAELSCTGAEFTRRWDRPAGVEPASDHLQVCLNGQRIALTRESLTASSDLRVMVFTTQKG